jgi:hypothetical protein
MTTVYVTAGDKHKSQQYWLTREAGVKEAYAYMAKVANEWLAEDLSLDNHKLTRFILRRNPKISLVFLRLPDGIDIRENEVTLKTIYQYDQVVIYSLDQKNWYRKYDLVKILKALMDYFQPEVIEYVYPGNHVDHQYVDQKICLEILKNGKVVKRIQKKPYYVKQRSGYALGYDIVDFKAAKFPGDDPTFTAFKVELPENFGRYNLRLVDGRGNQLNGSLRNLRTVRNPSALLLLLVGLVPLLLGGAMVGNRVFQTKKKEALAVMER